MSEEQIKEQKLRRSGGEPYTFYNCCIDLIGNKEFVYHFNRLTGSKIGVSTGLNRMIDDACGLTQYEINKKYFPTFMEIVYELIWLRLPDEAFDD